MLLLRSRRLMQGYKARNKKTVFDLHQITDRQNHKGIFRAPSRSNRADALHNSLVAGYTVEEAIAEFGAHTNFSEADCCLFS